MTVWELRCESCGNIRTLDVGFDLYEMGKVYLYCSVCGKNTFHVVIGVKDHGSQ